MALPAGFSRGQNAGKPLKGVCICPVPLFQVKLRDFATSPHSNEIGKQFSELPTNRIMRFGEVVIRGNGD